MSTLKASPKYIESVQQSQVNTKPRQSAHRESRGRETQQSQQIQDLQQQLHIKDEQLQEKQQENQQQQQQILGLQTLLTAKHEQLNHELQQKEAAMAAHQQEIQQLRQQLQSSEQVAAEFQQNLLEKEKTIQELQQQLRQRRGQRREEEVKASGAAASGGRIELRWRDGGKAPCKMGGKVAPVDGGVAYFTSGPGVDEVFAYNSADNKWSELPKCPNRAFSPAMINGLLTAIGGKKSIFQLTNSLLSLTGKKWTVKFPPMPTKHWLTSALCSGRSLIVAGGVGEGDKRLSVVEVMDTETLQWSTTSSLPHTLCGELPTICGDQVYMMGGFDQSAKYTNSLFTCSLAVLLQSCQPQSLGTQMNTLSLASRPKVWHQLADTPVTFSSWVALHGKLLAVGG